MEDGKVKRNLDGPIRRRLDCGSWQGLTAFFSFAPAFDYKRYLCHYNHCALSPSLYLESDGLHHALHTFPIFLRFKYFYTSFFPLI